MPALVPIEGVAGLWHHLLPHVEASLARSAGEYWPEDVRAFCESGAWRVWIATRPGELVAMAMTQVMTYPRCRLLFVQLAGASEGEGLTAMWPMVRDFAAGAGCGAIRFSGRPGWLRSGRIPAMAAARLEQHSIVVPVEG